MRIATARLARMTAIPALLALAVATQAWAWPNKPPAPPSPSQVIDAGKDATKQAGDAAKSAAQSMGQAMPLPPPPYVGPLPPPPPQSCRGDCEVSRNDRVLIFLNNTATHAADKFRLLYRFFESSGKAGTMAELGPFYRTIHELAGSAATSENFLLTLGQLEADPSVKAIDLLISLHGAQEKLFFHEGEMSIRDLSRKITKRRMSACSGGGGRNEACEEQRMQKLRVAYSAACYGVSHLPFWSEAGFAASAGALGVHTDSVASFPTFLSTWKNGYSFADAVQRANQADAQHQFDHWAKLNPDWSDANSTRAAPSRPGSDPRNVYIWTKTRQTYHR